MFFCAYFWISTLFESSNAKIIRTLMKNWTVIVFSSSSPGRTCGTFDNEIVMMNHVYKERFPKVGIIIFWLTPLFPSTSIDSSSSQNTFVSTFICSFYLLFICQSYLGDDSIFLIIYDVLCDVRCLWCTLSLKFIVTVDVISRPQLRWRGVCWTSSLTAPQTAPCLWLTACWASSSTS